MSSQPWMPLYVADYQLDTLDLTAEEHGVYLILLMLMWRRGGSLPNDLVFLKRSLGSCVSDMHGNRFNRVVPKLLERYFSVNEAGELFQKRLGNELEKARKRSGNARENVGKRWSKSRENKDLVDTPVILARAFLQSQSHKTVVNTTETPAAPTLPDDDPMRAFWRDCKRQLSALLDRPESQCGAILGKLLHVARNDSDRVLDAIKRAAYEQPADPLPWMVACLKRGPPSRADRPKSGQEKLIHALRNDPL